MLRKIQWNIVCRI